MPFTNSSGISAIMNWMTNSFTSMAMVDYPYPTKFLEDLPAWPCNYSCQSFKDLSNKKIEEIKSHDLLSAAFEAARVFYDFKKTKITFDIYNPQSSSSSIFLNFFCIKFY